MHKIKSHKTIEQIARKHRLEVSFVKNQLEMGIPIEHEHTKDKDLATDIALQHLDEIPDYYTRLKKMEASAKKSHKKYKDVKESLDGKSSKDSNYSLRDWFKGGGWVQAGGKYDGKPCAKQPGQTTKPFCRDPDDRAAMPKKERNKRAAKKRKEDPNPNRSGVAKNVTKEEFIREKKGEKDACYHKVKSRYKIWPSAYASGALSKCRKVGAGNWGTKSEEVEVQRYCPKCQKNESKVECKYGPKYWEMFSVPMSLSSDAYDPNKPHPTNEEKDHEHSMARSEISTIISAVKRLKKNLKGEGNLEAWVQSKITKAADYLDTAADYVDSGEMKSESVYNESKLTGSELSKGEGGSPYEPYNKQKGPSQPTQPPGGFDKFREKYGIPKKSSLQMANSKSVDENLILQDVNGNDSIEIIDLVKPEKIKNSVSEKCWDGYTRKGMKMKKGKMVPNCVKETYSNWREDLIEDWQKVNRKDKTDGLSPDAVKAYRRENPGSKLQTAVTTDPSKLEVGSKDWKRRKNFCSRSQSWNGERGKAARRRWNCN